MNTIELSTRTLGNIGVSCPVWTCRAKPGQLCVSQMGQKLKHCHRQRMEKARAKGKTR